MRRIVLLMRLFSTGAVASLAALLVTLHPQALSAKTPDGVPPSQETVCSGLTGAAFGLCNAYCEAQDCDVHPRPSCALCASTERLREAFRQDDALLLGVRRVEALLTKSRELNIKSPHPVLSLRERGPFK